MTAIITKETEERMLETGNYYDTLHDFSKTMAKLNRKAADGEPPKGLQSYCRRLLPVFVLLCGDLQQETKKPGRKPKERPEPQPQFPSIKNTLQVRDDWGRCPKCGGKCIKVKPDTVLINYPMFCKHCKSESIVTWKAPQ